MKNLILIVFFLILCSFVPEAEQGLKIDFGIVIGILFAIYEAISRIIPSSKTWSIIGKVLEFLTWLSSILDRKKK